MFFPDACGGGGRGWIGKASRHGIRETCALHTTRPSCDSLVDFWSALGEETRYSLLKMKEEDFIERLNYRYEFEQYFMNLPHSNIKLCDIISVLHDTQCH